MDGGISGSPRKGKSLILLIGNDPAAFMQAGSGAPCPWPMQDGVLTVEPGAGDICTRLNALDVELHLEFWLPFMPDKTGQDRANSGVFLQGLYEIQILDSFRNTVEPERSCGALYGQVPPIRNAAFPAERWQSLDVHFIAPRFNRRGERIKDGALTVIHNSVRIHSGAPVTTPTGGGLKDHNPARPGPLLLQDHGAPVRFRNLRMRVL